MKSVMTFVLGAVLAGGVAYFAMRKPAEPVPPAAPVAVLLRRKHLLQKLCVNRNPCVTRTPLLKRSAPKFRRNPSLPPPSPSRCRPPIRR